MNFSAKYFIQQQNTTQDIINYCRTLTHYHGDPASAVEVLQYFVERDEYNQILWSNLSDYLITCGELQSARNAAKKSIDVSAGCPHIKDVITAKIDSTLAVVDDDHKVLFVNIPKCSSSTIKNYFTYCLFDKDYGETVHFQHKNMYKVVKWSQLGTIYKDYYKFSVYRDPIERVLSYYKKNIAEHSLVKEASGVNVSNNFPTKPGVLYAMRNFHDYRRLFTDFRHHTDTMTDYLGDNLDLYDRIYDISECDEIKNTLSEIYSKDIVIQDSMVTSNDVDVSRAKNDSKAMEFLTRFYELDYKMNPN